MRISNAKNFKMFSKHEFFFSDVYNHRRRRRVKSERNAALCEKS